jgi:NTE family protein
LVIVFSVISLQEVFPQRIGLVLSGGGAKGIAHVGLIKALEDNHIPIDYITGTSIGAVVGALYATGYSPDEMMELFRSDKFLSWQSGHVEENYVYYFKRPEATPEFVRFKIGIKDSLNFITHLLPKSLINPIQFNYAFMEMFAAPTATSKGDFNNLFIPFRCVASDVNNKRSVVFGSGDLGDAVRASSAFPFVYKSVKVDSLLLFDGGIYDNFPLQPMFQHFNPDYVIGSVVVNRTEDRQIDENDLIDQLEGIVMQSTRYRLRRQEGGIIIRYELKNVSLLDFKRAEELFQTGYEQGLQYIDSIKQQVNRRIPEEELELRRIIYKSELPELVFKKIVITGVNYAQRDHIEDVIHKNHAKFTLEDFKTAYFKLLSDGKILEIIPHAIYNPVESCFDLHLEVVMDENIVVSFGGNISSTTSNQAFIGIGYQSLSKYAIDYSLEGNLGMSYNSVLLSGRVELPTRRMPMDLQLMGMFCSQKYYNSENLFNTENMLAFIRQEEAFAKLRIGFPFLMKGKSEISIGYGMLRDFYYQSNNVAFASTDFDRSRYKLAVGSFRIEHNSLNSKLFATEGTAWYMIAQIAVGNEDFQSAPAVLENGSIEKVHEQKDHSWLQMKGMTRTFHSISSKFNYGLHLEGVLSGKNFFNNYTSTIIQSPAFTPTPHSKTVFNEKFRANQYVAAGLIPIWKSGKYFHVRAELYGFLPFNEILRRKDNKATQGRFLNNFQYLGEVSLVCQLPFMSVSIFGNHYSYPAGNWNFGLNIGYQLFRSGLIE